MPPSTGIPSTMKRGSELLTVPIPRILIWEPEPGWPEAWVIWTPETLPLRASLIVEALTVLSWSPSTFEIDAVTTLFFWTPYPITIVSSRSSLSSARMIVRGEPSTTMTDCDL